MLASGRPWFRFRSAFIARGAFAAAALAVVAGPPAFAQEADRIRPVTAAELENPAPGDWLMWRRTLDGWGYSPLDRIDRGNVDRLRLVWSRALTPGRQQGTPLVRDGVLFMPNPRDVIQALDAVTGDLIWEHRRDRPDDLADYMIGTLIDTNRNIAIHGELIIDTSMDDHVFALHAETGAVVWDTEILDYRVNPANQTSGPIVAGGKVFSGRSCDPRGGPNGCVVTAHDAETGEELWRRRLIPAPGEPGDETWGDVPFERRSHVGSWMVPSYDPELNLVYVGTSVTSPAPKFMLGGVDKTHLYHNSTLALNGDTGEGARQICEGPPSGVQGRARSADNFSRPAVHWRSPTMPEESIAALEQRRAHLCRQLASIGEMRSGSLMARGKTGCGCAPPGKAQRGPVLSLTRKESGKTVTRIIPAQAAEQAWAEAAEYRRFRRLSQELIEASDALSEARLRAGSGSESGRDPAAAAAGAGKKGAARRRSRAKSTPKSMPW